MKWATLLLAAGLASGCMTAAEKQAYRQSALAEAQYRHELQRKANALPESDKLDCEMRGRAVTASESNPRAFINLVAEADGIMMVDTCLRMKIAKADEDEERAKKH